MKRLLALLGALLVPVSGSPQTWLEEALVYVCERGDCGEKVILTAQEHKYVEKLVSHIDQKTSEADLVRFFGRPPFARSGIGPTDWPGRTGERMSFSVDPKLPSPLEAHVDVYTVEGAPFLLRWWSRGLRRRISIHLAE